MSASKAYQPGAATGARVDKAGDTWTLVVVRTFKHPPALVWEAITDPAHLREWAPFDPDRNLGSVGSAKLTTVGAPAPNVAETKVTRAEAPHMLEYDWGGNAMRWELQPVDGGTRLTLWHNIDKGYIAMGAAGWQICFDVMERALDGDPIGRHVGPGMMQFDGWQRLFADYSKQFGIEPPAWMKGAGA